jgi:hypothetical protein
MLNGIVTGDESWVHHYQPELKCASMQWKYSIGPKREEVMGSWRKLHNEELHNLYCSPSIIRMIKSRRMRWAGHVARMGTKMNVYTIFLGKSEGERPLGRPRRRWVNNIEMDLRDIHVG